MPGQFGFQAGSNANDIKQQKACKSNSSNEHTRDTGTNVASDQHARCSNNFAASWQGLALAVDYKFKQGLEDMVCKGSELAYSLQKS